MWVFTILRNTEKRTEENAEGAKGENESKWLRQEREREKGEGD